MTNFNEFTGFDVYIYADTHLDMCRFSISLPRTLPSTFCQDYLMTQNIKINKHFKQGQEKKQQQQQNIFLENSFVNVNIWLSLFFEIWLTSQNSGNFTLFKCKSKFCNDIWNVHEKDSCIQNYKYVMLMAL